MLENYKNIHGRYQEGGESLKNEISRRLIAEQELKLVQKRNVSRLLFRNVLKKESKDIFTF